jgi:hypothetical protein
MVEHMGAAKTSLEQWAARLLATLEQAHEALAEGDAAGAERAGRAVSALVHALREVDELETFARSRRPEENEEEQRADLERRIARFVAADRAEDLLEGLEHD